jgi:hypothetical protein
MLLLQGDGRHPDGPAHLGALLRACDAGLWGQLLVTQNMQDWPEKKVLAHVGTVAANIVQEMGPLHIKINACKDMGEFWRITFIGALFFKATAAKKFKKKCTCDKLWASRSHYWRPGSSCETLCGRCC